MAAAAEILETSEKASLPGRERTKPSSLKVEIDETTYSKH
jgi:hypothetical protein